MNKTLFAFLALIFLFTEVSALCESGQIDINSASLKELDGLAGIGPVKAQAIIDARPFNSIDSLIDVTGIGNATLDKIKTQGLACVEGEESIQEEENTQEENIQDKNNNRVNNIQEEVKSEEDINNSIIEQPLTITSEEVKTIVLNPKDIKSETDKEQLNKNKLAIYGLIVFCILLALLFIFERKKKKNEFE